MKLFYFLKDDIDDLNKNLNNTFDKLVDTTQIIEKEKKEDLELIYENILFNFVNKIEEPLYFLA